MSADPDIVCSPAPAAKPSAGETMVIDRAAPGSPMTKYILAILFLALVAGAIAFLAMRGGGSAPTSVGTVTVGSGSSENVATATGTDDTPAECLGDVDINRRWYCQHFLPFAKKASADHDRLDRLEAQGAGSGNGVPYAVWIVLAAIGILTVYNTMKIHSRREEPPPK